MYINKRRTPTLVDICDFHRLNLRETNARLNVKNYFQSKLPLLPMSFRDLRLVVTNRIPSNVLILPKAPSPVPMYIPKLPHRQQKSMSKKSMKPPGYDVYRSLARSTTTTERDSPTNEDLNLLAASVTIDRISPLSHSGSFRTNNLPKIYKTHYHSSHNIKFNSDDESELFGSIRQTPTELKCEQMNQSTDQTRKQIHVFIPTINP